MAENSTIEWTTHTFNPWRGCTKVSPGCAHCYAETLSARNPGTLGKWGPNGTRVIASETQWKLVRKWDREAAIAGRRDRVFCASLADVFEGPETMPAEAWPKVRAARVRFFHLISETPDLDWLLLTKRPENVRRFCEAGDRSWAENTPRNVWLGTSVENQAAADARIPHLLATDARVRFLSMEPLLGPVDLSRYLPNTFTGFPRGPRVNWAIVGGESGPKARPVHPRWVRSLRDQCRAAGVPFFFKQWGEYGPEQTKPIAFTPVTSGVPMDEPASMFRVGKKDAGRLLDGREWNEVPA